MNKKNQIKLILVLVCCIGFLKPCTAQSSNVSDIMGAIYKNYDSIQYLSFDVQFNFESDTILGKFISEKMDGTFTMAGKKFKYRLGDIDFMQNDSFFIAIYNQDKMMLVDAPKALNAGSKLPLREQMDSLLVNYGSHYTITNYSIGDDTGIVKFIRADSLAQFDEFRITYAEQAKLLLELAYNFKEPAELDTAVVSMLAAAGNSSAPLQNKILRIKFSNYRFDNNDEEMYSEGNYFWLEQGLCKPSDKYKGYKIYYNKPTDQFYEKQDIVQ